MLQSSATTTFSAHFSCSRLFEINIFIQIEGCRKHLDLEIPTQKLACKGKIMKIYYNKIRERKRPRCLFTRICLVPTDISLSLSLDENLRATLACHSHFAPASVRKTPRCMRRRLFVSWYSLTRALRAARYYWHPANTDLQLLNPLKHPLSRESRHYGITDTFLGPESTILLL